MTEGLVEVGVIKGYIIYHKGNIHICIHTNYYIQSYNNTFGLLRTTFLGSSCCILATCDCCW